MTAACVVCHNSPEAPLHSVTPQNGGHAFTQYSASSLLGSEGDGDAAIRPAHYLHPSGVECIVVAQHHTFSVGSALKYLWRCGKKPGETDVRDIKKAIQYLQFELDRIEAENAPRSGTS